MKRLIATSADGGIGDRCRLLLAAHSIAVLTGRDFAFVWLVNEFCGAFFDDLFVAKGIRVVDRVVEPMATQIQAWSTPYPGVLGLIKSLDDEVIQLHAFMPDASCESWDAFIGYSRKVIDAVVRFGAEHPFDDSLIGVHVRGRDYHWKRPPLEKYFEAIDRFDARRRLFLCSDEYAIRREFASRYGSRLVQYPVLPFDRNSRESTIESAVELCLLRSCLTLVLSMYSGFSVLAIKGPRSVQGEGVGVIEDNL